MDYLTIRTSGRDASSDDYSPPTVDLKDWLEHTRWYDSEYRKRKLKKYR